MPGRPPRYFGSASSSVRVAAAAANSRSAISLRLKRHHGSISAEHGIGLVKKGYLESTRSADEIAVMRGIKRVLDPNGLMNPGKLFDT